MNLKVQGAFFLDRKVDWIGLRGEQKNPNAFKPFLEVVSLRPLLEVRGKPRYCIRHRWAWSKWLQVRRLHGWALFQSSEQSRVRRTRLGNESVSSAHTIDPALLALAQDLEWQGGEITEDPKQVNSLSGRRPNITWARRCEHTKNSLRKLFGPHADCHPDLEHSNSNPEEKQFEGQHYSPKMVQKGSRNSAFLGVFWSFVENCFPSPEPENLSWSGTGGNG